MQAEDAELEQFRRGVNCAALLEGWSPSWRLDRKGSGRFHDDPQGRTLLGLAVLPCATASKGGTGSCAPAIRVW